MDRPTAPSANSAPGCVGSTVRITCDGADVTAFDPPVTAGCPTVDRNLATATDATRSMGKTSHRDRRVKRGSGCAYTNNRAPGSGIRGWTSSKPDGAHDTRWPATTPVPYP